MEPFHHSEDFGVVVELLIRKENEEIYQPPGAEIISDMAIPKGDVAGRWRILAALIGVNKPEGKAPVLAFRGGHILGAEPFNPALARIVDWLPAGIT